MPIPRNVRTRTGTDFPRRFRRLVFHAWNIPPVFGLGFILLIGVLTPGQIAGILPAPREPAYIIGWLLFAIGYLPRQVRPLADWLDRAPDATPEAALRALRAFPPQFWTTVLVYLVLAPVSVVRAAHLFTDYDATLLDLFGRAVGTRDLGRPTVTVRTKVFLIGAVVPLLIDTKLVQYCWTRTGCFTAETFGM